MRVRSLGRSPKRDFAVAPSLVSWSLAKTRFRRISSSFPLFLLYAVERLRVDSLPSLLSRRAVCTAHQPHHANSKRSRANYSAQFKVISAGRGGVSSQATSSEREEETSDGARSAESRSGLRPSERRRRRGHPASTRRDDLELSTVVGARTL